MSEKVIATKIVERTIAHVRFDDGRERTIESAFGDSQNGRGYDGGTWGPYPEFRTHVETEVREAQTVWALPAATITYTRVTKTIEAIERTTVRKARYSERRVASEVEQ